MAKVNYFRVIFFSALLVIIHQLTSAKLILNTASSVTIMPGSGFMKYIKHDEGEIIHECFLTYPLEKVNHTIKIILDKAQDFSNAPIFGARLSNLERDLCGIKVSESKEGDSPNMTLAANYKIPGDDAMHSFNSSFKISHFTNTLTTNFLVEAELGTKAKVECGKNIYGKSCTLFDPSGKVISKGKKRCEYDISYTTMDHVGNWTCVTNMAQSMKPVKQILELRTYGRPTVKTWYKEEDGYGKIGCQYVYRNVGNVKNCEFTNPQNKIYHITMSSATERYASTGTNFNEARCEIQFKLPLLEEEIGIWKCHIRRDISSGGFIDVFPQDVPSNEFSVRRTRSLSYPKKVKQTVHLGESFFVICKLPYSTRSCYMNSPSGDYYFGGGIEYFYLGECISETMTAQAKHLGIWKCHFARDGEVADEVIEVEVVEEYNLHSESPEIAVEFGKSATLMCTATTPIQSCQFVGPNKATYNLSPDKRNGEIVYAGQGLEYGDCGLKIKSVREEHEGNWICLANNMGDRKDSLNDTIRISFRTFAGLSTSTASAIGVPVGIMVVAVLLLGAALIRRFTKRTPTNSTRTSGGSNTDIPIFDLQTISNYETTSN